MSIATVQKIIEESKSLSPEEKFEVIDFMIKSIRGECFETQKKSPRSLLELRGLGKEIWEGVDPMEYVKQERDSWER